MKNLLKEDKKICHHLSKNFFKYKKPSDQRDADIWRFDTIRFAIKNSKSPKGNFPYGNNF